MGSTRRGALLALSCYLVLGLVCAKWRFVKPESDTVIQSSNFSLVFHMEAEMSPGSCYIGLAGEDEINRPLIVVTTMPSQEVRVVPADNGPVNDLVVERLNDNSVLVSATVTAAKPGAYMVTFECGNQRVEGFLLAFRLDFAAETLEAAYSCWKMIVPTDFGPHNSNIPNGDTLSVEVPNPCDPLSSSQLLELALLLLEADEKDGAMALLERAHAVNNFDLKVLTGLELAHRRYGDQTNADIAKNARQAIVDGRPRKGQDYPETCRRRPMDPARKNVCDAVPADDTPVFHGPRYSRRSNLAADPSPLYSSVQCKKGEWDEHTCLYENVCFLGSSLLYFLPDGAAEPTDVNYNTFNTVFEWGAVSNFSGQFIMQTVRAPLQAIGNVNFLPGRTQWLDGPTCHFGHAYSEAMKLPGDRAVFPGDIHQLLWIKPSYMPDSLCWCKQTLDMFRLAFEGEGFNLPPIYNINPMVPAYGTMCFRQLSNIHHTHLFLRNHAEADAVRSAAWKMCQFQPSPRPRDLKMVIIERGYNRFVTNAEDMCEAKRREGVDASLYVEQLDFCSDLRAVADSDILVSIAGTPAHMAIFMRPATVLIVIMPISYYLWCYKLLTYFAGVRYLDYMVIDAAHTSGGTKHIYGRPGPDSDAMWEMCSSLDPGLTSIFNQCRFVWWNRDVFVPPELFEGIYLGARNMIGDPEFAPCEVPVYTNTQWDYNYEVCEPDNYPLCWNDHECRQLMIVNRMLSGHQFIFKKMVNDPTNLRPHLNP